MIPLGKTRFLAQAGMAAELHRHEAPRVVIVILNWNGKEDTLECLASVGRLQYPNHHVLVVDNGSADGSIEAIASAYPHVTVVPTGANLGFAEGNNVGIRAALDTGAAYVMLLNNDTEIAPDCLDHLLAVFQERPGAGVIGPRVFYMHERSRIWFEEAKWSSEKADFIYPGQGKDNAELPQEPHDTEYVCGAAMMFRAEVARNIGLLDPRFFLVYEESDWCFRARRAGYQCLTVPKARIWHKIGTSFGGEESPLRTYFAVRNRLLWLEKNQPRRIVLKVVLGEIAQLTKEYTMNIWRWLKSTLTRDFFRQVYWSFQNSRWRVRVLGHVLAARWIGVWDYVFRRFGNCPDAIRSINASWAQARATTSG